MFLGLICCFLMNPQTCWTLKLLYGWKIISKIGLQLCWLYLTIGTSWIPFLQIFCIYIHKELMYTGKIEHGGLRYASTLFFVYILGVITNSSKRLKLKNIRINRGNMRLRCSTELTFKSSSISLDTMPTERHPCNLKLSYWKNCKLILFLKILYCLF